jgi:hypothetical protein
VIAALVAGIRHAIRLPAELQARWVFQMCWSGDHREYLRGSMRAALMLLVLPILMTLGPLHVWIGGWRFALMHLVWGGLFASALLGALLIGFDKLPFAGSYAQKTTFKSLAPFYLFAFWTGTQIVASMEHAALTDVSGAAWLAGTLLLTFAASRVLGGSPSARSAMVTADEAPDEPTQRLGLHV